MINYHESAYKILGILQDIAPNGEAQEKCSKLYKDTQSITMDSKECLLRMIGVLYDGLAYGNWPWTKYPSE